MIQTGIKLKNIVHFLKEHLSILIIIPAFIGGLWQALELMLMSISYIRFFSISQIVPDGILILIFLFFIFIVFSLGILGDTLFYLKGNKKLVKNSNEVDIEKVRKRDLINPLGYFLIFF